MTQTLKWDELEEKLDNLLLLFEIVKFNNQSVSLEDLSKGKSD